MSLLARLAPHLPYVRRYARALTGDQATGDNYVRVALEALAAGEAQLDANLTPQLCALTRVGEDRFTDSVLRKLSVGAFQPGKGLGGLLIRTVPHPTDACKIGPENGHGMVQS